MPAPARRRSPTKRADQQAAEAEATRKTLEDELNVKLADAEKTIAATKQAAMANVRGIADGCRPRHRRAADRLGAERTAAVDAAVADVLKR